MHWTPDYVCCTALAADTQTLLSLLGTACTSDRSALPPATFRVACVIVADIVVKTCSEWRTWRSDLQQIVDASLAQKSAMGAIMVRCSLQTLVSSASSAHSVSLS